MGTFDIPELSARESSERMKADPTVRLIDVRSDDEYAITRIPGAVLVNSEERVAEILALPKTTPIIVHCHHGVRSLSGAGYLLDHGFTEVYSMAGGIDAWSCDVDPTVPRY